MGGSYVRKRRNMRAEKVAAIMVDRLGPMGLKSNFGLGR